MSAGDDSWEVGDSVPAGGVDLGELTHWELLLLAPGPATAVAAGIESDAREDIVEAVGTSLRSRYKLDDDGLLRPPERSALAARRLAAGGVTCRGPAPSASVAFEVRIGPDYALIEEHDEQRVRFRVFDADSWSIACADLLGAGLPSEARSEFDPQFIVRWFQFTAGRLDWVEALVGRCDEGIAIAVEGDDEVDLFVVDQSELAEFLERACLLADLG